MLYLRCTCLNISNSLIWSSGMTLKALTGFKIQIFLVKFEFGYQYVIEQHLIYFLILKYWSYHIFNKRYIWHIPRLKDYLSFKESAKSRSVILYVIYMLSYMLCVLIFSTTFFLSAYSTIPLIMTHNAVKHEMTCLM